MASRQGDWIRRKKVELIQFFGSRCNNPLCQIHWNLEPLQFAHLKPTEVSGMGRGLHQRVLDINRNRESYTLLCQTCHSKFDDLNYKVDSYTEPTYTSKIEVVKTKYRSSRNIIRPVREGYPKEVK